MFTKSSRRTSSEVGIGAVILIGLYITCQLAADITAVKLVEIGNIIIPAGTFVFALTFTLRDMLHERLGYQTAVNAIWVAAGANVLLVAYMLLTVTLPFPVFWDAQEAYARVLGPVLRITIASIIAELVSELSDTVIYETVRNSGGSRVLAVAVSNGASTVLDTITFTLCAFGGNLPFAVILTLAKGQVLFKWAVTAISLPLIRLVKSRKEGKNA